MLRLTQAEFEAMTDLQCIYNFSWFLSEGYTFNEKQIDALFKNANLEHKVEYLFHVCNPMQAFAFLSFGLSEKELSSLLAEFKKTVIITD